MADITTENIKGAMKDWYLDGLRVQINEEADPLWAQLNKTAQVVAGEKIVLSLRFGRVGGIGARAETDDLPDPNPRKSEKATFDPKNMYGRMRIYERAIRASANNRGAFVNMLEQSLEDLVTDCKDFVSSSLYGDGSGKIATVIADHTAEKTIQLDSVIGLAEGMYIDVLKGDDKSALAEKAEILAVDDDNNKITLDKSVTTDKSRGDYITRAGSADLEMTGLGAIFTPNNTIYGLDRSTRPYLNPTRVNINGEISEVGIQGGLDKAYTRTGVRHDFLIGSFGVQRAWMNLMISFRQHVNTVELKGGWSAPVYQNGSGRNLPFIAAKYAKTSRLWALSLQNFVVGWYGDWDWLDRDGSMLTLVPNKAAWEATLQLYADLCCDTPRGQVEFYNITEH